MPTRDRRSTDWTTQPTNCRLYLSVRDPAAVTGALSRAPSGKPAADSTSSHRQAPTAVKRPPANMIPPVSSNDRLIPAPRCQRPFARQTWDGQFYGWIGLSRV